MCGLLPCDKTRTEMRLNTRFEPTIEEVVQYSCCDGYAETPDHKCAPVCLNACQFGKCVAPNKCQCGPEPTDSTPGYAGSTCSRYICLSNKWGSNCDKDCPTCPKNAYCSGHSGKCVCKTGWHGANCTDECTNSIGCDDALLPPLVEPEANVLPELIGVTAQRLEARNSEAPSDDMTSANRIASMLATHIGINIMLTVVTLMLLISLFMYRRRLSQLSQELYYANSYSSGSGSGSGRSIGSTLSDSYYAAVAAMRNRPRMPTPSECKTQIDQSLLSKNLGLFDKTIDQQLLGFGGKSISATQTVADYPAEHATITNSRSEAHLAASQLLSRENLYSQIDVSTNTQPLDDIYKVPKQANQTTASNASDTVDNAYENGETIYEEIPFSKNQHDTQK